MKPTTAVRTAEPSSSHLDAFWKVGESASLAMVPMSLAMTMGLVLWGKPLINKSLAQILRSVNRLRSFDGTAFKLSASTLDQHDYDGRSDDAEENASAMRMRKMEPQPDDLISAQEIAC